MTGQKIRLKKLFDDYVESLDVENENKKLLMKLEDESKYSVEAKNYYEEARFNQYLHYKRLASRKESIVANTLISAFKDKKSQNTKDGNIWRYFNELMKSKGIFWRQILRNIKMDTKLADYFYKEEMNLYRISPEKLVDITNLLEANPNIVLQLAYKWLIETKNTTPNTLAISYREVRGDLEETGFDFTQTDQEENEIKDYMTKLEKAFH